MARCAHCSAPGATHTWDVQACADKRRKRAKRLCGPCDVRLNAMVLEFFNDPAAAAKMAAYRASMQEPAAP